MIKKIIVSLAVLALLSTWLVALHLYGRRVIFIRQAYQYFPQSLRNEVNRAARNILKISDIAYLLKRTPKSEIQVLELFVKQKDLNKLNSNLPTAWSQTERLTEEYQKYVPATLLVDGEEYKVKIRYRGWTPEHWSEEKKSLQIKSVEPETFKSKKTLKLILPEDRFFFVEALSNFIAKKLNLVSLDDGFIRLVINNQDFGIYYFVEDFGKEALERNGLNGETELFSEITQLPDSPVASVFESTEYWQREVTDEALALNDFSHLSELFESLKQDEQKEFLELIDREYFLRWQSHSMLLGSLRQDYLHNDRLFWDRNLEKFKIIPWDNGSIINPEQLDVNYNPIVNKIFANPLWVQERNKILWQYLKENFEEDIKFLENHYQEYRYWFYKDRKKIYPNLKFDRQTQQIKENLEKRYKNLLAMLKHLEPEISIQPEEKQLEIKIKNKDRVGLLIESLVFPVACFDLSSDFPQLEIGENECSIMVDELLVPYFKIPQGPDKFKEEYQLIPQEFELRVSLKEGTSLDWQKIKFNLLNQITGEKVSDFKLSYEKDES